MTTKKALSAEAKRQKEAADRLLTDPARLESLRRTGLMGSEREEAFDRLASLAAFILKVPLTIVSLISDKQQFFKAGYGLPSPYDQVRSLPINDSICRYTLADDPIVAGDAKLDPLVASQPIAKTLEIAAYIAIPMKDHRGYVLGAFCAIDTKPRAWSSDDVNIMRELTKSVMTEIHLREQLRELETEKISRETVVAALTHDLRTPVSAAKMASAALQEPDIDVEEQKQMIEIISRNMDRADRMIHDILDASRLKAGEGVPLNLRDADMKSVVTHSVETLTSLHGARFKTAFSGDLFGSWDTAAFERVLENLGSNAVKYGEPGSMITLSAKDCGDSIELRVHNVGEPIPPADLETIFEKYNRTDSAIKGPQKGWGIGLTLVKGFTEAHGGRIHVESSAINGTDFIMKIPRFTPTSLAMTLLN